MDWNRVSTIIFSDPSRDGVAFHDIAVSPSCSLRSTNAAPEFEKIFLRRFVASFVATR